MKRIFNLSIVFAIMVLGSLTLSSFTAPQSIIATSSVNSTQQAVYWSGRAKASADPNHWLKIEVYESPNTCNDYYAVVIAAGLGEEKVKGKKLVVKKGDRRNEYYVTWDGANFYFNM